MSGVRCGNADRRPDSDENLHLIKNGGGRSTRNRAPNQVFGGRICRGARVQRGHRSGYVRKYYDQLADGVRILQVDRNPLTLYSAAAVQALHKTKTSLRGESENLREMITGLDARMVVLDGR